MLIKFINGDEEDALNNCKRFFFWHPGQRKRIKNQYNRRVRKFMKFECKIDEGCQ